VVAAALLGAGALAVAVLAAGALAGGDTAAGAGSPQAAAIRQGNNNQRTTRGILARACIDSEFDAAEGRPESTRAMLSTVVSKNTLRYALVLLALVGCTPTTHSPTHPDKPRPRVVIPNDNLGVEALPADPREPLLAAALGQILPAEHLRRQPIDDSVSKQAFTEFMKRLDSGKLFLTKEQADALAVYADQMDDEIEEGDLLLARKAAALMVARHAVVAKAVAGLLTTPFDFTVDEEIETDPDKLDYCASEAELTDRWRQVLKLQMLQRLQQMDEVAAAIDKREKEGKKDGETTPIEQLEKIPATPEAREKKAREDMATSYEARFKRLDDVDPLEPVETFLNAITSIYDPHTIYMPPAEKENFDIQLSGSLEGIGAVLSEEGHYIVVRELVPGGASWRQGKLAAGDTILAVAQHGQKAVDVGDMPIQKVVKLIRGAKGTIVTLTVKKPDDRIEVISVTRDVVEIESAYARGAVLDLGGSHKQMGYVMLPSFYGPTRGKSGGHNATEDVRVILEDFKKRGLAGAIVDLRGNGGGLLDHARDISGLFIETGPVVQTRYANGKVQVLQDTDPSISFDGDVVVLVDRFSASASEILAGALQDYHRALIVGTGPTHGKGTVQVMVDLDQLRARPGAPLGVLKLTIQQYYGVTGESTQWRGVVPDVLLPDPAAHIESGERFLDHSIPASKIDPLPHTPWNAAWNTSEIVTKSKARRQAEPVFAKVDARSALLKARQKRTRVPLEREAWQARHAQDEKELEAVDPKLAEGKLRFTVTPTGAEAKPPVDSNGKSPKDTWSEELSRDPWVEEALLILEDM
jgi:carboxyl-terminal processing protease